MQGGTVRIARNLRLTECGTRTGIRNENSDPYFLGSLHKGSRIDYFARRETWSLAELAAELGQTKPTVFRILHTLGSAVVQHEQIRWQALPPLQDLARDTGETVHVGILYDGEAQSPAANCRPPRVRQHRLANA
jgi:hypothetical protein